MNNQSNQAQWTQATQTPATWGNQAQLTPQQLQQAMSLLQPQPNSQVGNAQQLQNTQPDMSQMGMLQTSVLPAKTMVTQPFNHYAPGLEVFSPTGRSLGVNFAAPEGMPVLAPKGTKWQVVKTYDGAAPTDGGIGHSGGNSGYGNDVLIKDLSSGYQLHMTHLSAVHVKPGDIINGGDSVGNVGITGNTTGSHLNLETIDPNGQLMDFFQSPYGQTPSQ